MAYIQERLMMARVWYIYILSFLTQPLFEVTVQIFVYKLLFTIVFFGKRKKTYKTFENEGLAS